MHDGQSGVNIGRRRQHDGQSRANTYLDIGGDGGAGLTDLEVDEPHGQSKVCVTADFLRDSKTGVSTSREIGKNNDIEKNSDIECFNWRSNTHQKNISKKYTRPLNNLSCIKSMKFVDLMEWIGVFEGADAFFPGLRPPDQIAQVSRQREPGRAGRV
jgi:hypothetical protein